MKQQFSLLTPSDLKHLKYFTLFVSHRLRGATTSIRRVDDKMFYYNDGMAIFTK